MRRNRYKIGLQFIDIKRNFTECLDRIDVQQATGAVNDFGDLRDRLHRAGLVIGEHDRDQRRRTVRQHVAQMIQIDDA